MAAPSAAPEPVEDRASLEARGLFEQGVELSHQERWAEAAEAFKKSRALIDRSSSAFNHGSTLYRLGQFVEAQAAFDAYQRMATPDDPLREEGLRMVALLERAVATLTLDARPADLRLRVDGVVRSEMGATRSLKLNPGSHLVVATARSHRGLELTLELAEGEQQHHALRLEPEPAVANGSRSNRSREADDGGGWLSSPWFWLATVAIVGAGTTAAIVLVSQEDEVGGVDKGTTGVLLTSLTL